MKVLVTGSTGFLGAALCRALVERGDDVRAFHRPTSTLRMLADLPVEHALGDLTQSETIAAAMQGVDVVFHAAALMGSRQSGRQYAVTVEGTRAVLRAALEAGVKRLVHTSSVASLGVPEISRDRRVPFAAVLMNEEKTWNYRPDYWPYGYAKYLAELEVQKSVLEGLDAVIVNPSLVFGPGDVYRQTNSTIVQVAKQRVRVLTEGGCNVIHLADVVAGHLAALERGRRGERYILGAENLTHEALVRKIAAIANVAPPTTILPGSLVRSFAGVAGLLENILPLPISAELLHLAGYSFYYDSSKAQIDLGLGPFRSADEALADAYTWFKETGAL